MDGWRRLSNADLSAIPAVIGTSIILLLTIPAGCCVNFERGDSLKPKYQSIATIETKKYNLFNNTLEYIYKNYGSGYSGLGESLASLTEGVLTNAQKSKLHQLDSEYHKNAQIIDEYARCPSEMMEGIKANPEHRYTRAAESLTALESQWKRLKSEIACNSSKVSTPNASSVGDDDL